VPGAMKPNDFWLFLVGLKEDRPEVIPGWTGRDIEPGEACTEEFMYRPVILLASCRAVAHTFASFAEVALRLAAHKAEIGYFGVSHVR
jgi:hypothetical protein